MRVNKIILEWSILILFIALCIFSYKISWVAYLLSIITLLVLVLNIVSIKRIYDSKEKKLSIRVSYYRYIYDIVFILLLILNFNVTDLKEHRSIVIIYIIFFIIDLPIEYKKNSKIHFFENGIFIDRGLFNQKIVPYSKIEKLNFVEYLKGKFLLNIQLEKSFVTGVHEYKIKENDKEDIISFINDFIDKEKVIETKEYKEDSLW